MIPLTDTHSHLYAEEFDADREEALARACEAGIERIYLPAIDSESHEALFALCRQHPTLCRPMMGLHPTSINDNPRWREELALVKRLLDIPPEGILPFCAVGEIGLDFYWSTDFQREQEEAFITQCRWAAALDLPVVIHTRNAWERMGELLREEIARAEAQGKRLRGVFHAFTEGVECYRVLRDCGFLFGIGGVVTFKKSPLAEAVREMELEEMLLETDCPYLTPVPHRGTRNESAYVRFVCEKIAELKGLSPAEVGEATTKNARQLFEK